MNEILIRASVSQRTRGRCPGLPESLLRCLSKSLLKCLFFSVSGMMPVQAQYVGNPFLGKNQYPQYRQLSGLSGGGYGVSADGRSSLEGPTAYSTPIAYVPGHDQIRLSFSSQSFDSAPNFAVLHANGKGIVSYGHTFGQFNIMASDTFKSHNLDQAYNLQAGIIPLRGEKLGFSIGVQDILGLGGSAGEALPTDRYSSQSVFMVGTYRIDTARRPIYFSAGIGTHRYTKSFESASYQFLKPLRGFLEYDGWGLSEGLLLTGHTGHGHSALELNANVVLIRGRFLTIGASIGF